jgi:hypothetical protein
MAFMSGDFVYVAGNLATDPRVQRFPAKDGLYDEVVWMTVAVNHTDAATDYVELEARGKTKEYIKNFAAAKSKAAAIADGAVRPGRVGGMAGVCRGSRLGAAFPLSV